MGTNIDTSSSFYVVDNSGVDLLNPNNANSINFDDIRVFDIINGEEIEINNPNSDAPKGISLINPSPNSKYDKYRLAISFRMDLGEKSKFSYIVIKWNESDTDTFKGEMNRGSNHIVCTKMWHNEVKVWDEQDGDERFFSITK